MKIIFLLRLLLFPFSILYRLIVSIRNKMFDLNILESTSFSLPIISVGNLSVGGTGKTPQIEYLIRLLGDNSKLAVLSRGYKRKTKGFLLANKKTTVNQLGDEPFQYHKKFKKVKIAVCEDRVLGVKKILFHKPKTKIVLLDDAFQHRKIKPGFQILLTSYSDLFYNDFVLPMGNLRESIKGKKRANIIIVTKCPNKMSLLEQQQIVKKIAPTKNQQVFFTKISYADKVYGTSKISLKSLKQEKIVLVTGIAKPQPLLDYLTKQGIKFQHLEFPDHHNFSVSELKLIHEKSYKNKVITTEKDFVRLESEIEELYYLPIKTTFISDNELFDETVLNFVDTF